MTVCWSFQKMAKLAPFFAKANQLRTLRACSTGSTRCLNSSCVNAGMWGFPLAVISRRAAVSPPTDRSEQATGST